MAEGSVRDLSIDEGGKVNGVLMEADGRTSGEDWGVRAEKVIVTTGTFLRGLIHVGKETTPAGWPFWEHIQHVQGLGFRV